MQKSKKNIVIATLVDQDIVEFKRPPQKRSFINDLASHVSPPFFILEALEAMKC